MQFKSFALVALSAVAVSAQVDSVALSVLSVLKTAIPSESISSAIADPSGFAAELSSSLAAGKIPKWYLALPTDVQEYLPKLYPASTVVETTAYATVAPSTTAAPSTTVAPSSTPAVSTPLTTIAPIVSSSATISISGSIVVPGNSTISHVSSATLKSTGGPEEVSTAGAPRMTAGAVVAGVFGLVGMFAL